MDTYMNEQMNGQTSNTDAPLRKQASQRYKQMSRRCSLDQMSKSSRLPGALAGAGWDPALAGDHSPLLPSSGSVGYSAQRLPCVFSLPGHYCPLDRNLCDVSRRSQVSV